MAHVRPDQSQALDQIKFQTELAVEPVIVDHAGLLKLMEKLRPERRAELNELIGDELNIDFAEDEASAGAPTPAAADDIDDAPVVRFLQKILIDAINLGASDMHFEPYEKFYRIRMRVDGVLRDVAQPPLAIKEKLASRIKVISKLDISEKRVPQDGRMKLVLSKTRSIDFRVSTLPTLFGEKIVMRILDPTQAQMGIDALGYDPDQKQILLDAIERPYGMVLVTGPTGSGKTVSLYTCLNMLNKPGINISTAEDPAEINLPGVNQVNVNDRAGLTFPVALKAFLRQDPDVIMVGEIRDLETADIAIKAAQTGHMVFSTLHTNDAPSTLTRLMNMGVAPFNIASSVILITAQRLARRLCTCKQTASIPDEALLEAGFTEDDLDGTWMPYKPVGCERCSGSGYKGRVGIYQVMPISEEIERIILAHGNGTGNRGAGQGRRRQDPAPVGPGEGQARPHQPGRSARLHQRITRGRQMATAARSARAGQVKESIFAWEGKDKQRQDACRGEMRASGEAVVNVTLRRQGILVTKVKKKIVPQRQEDHRQGHHAVHAPAGDHDEGRRAAAAVVRHRRPRATPTPRCRSCCTTSAADVETGTSLNQAFRKYPLYFDPLFCNLVGAGEQAGILEDLLTRLAIYKEKTLAIKGKIKSALFYPISILVVAFVVTAVIMILVVPAFKEVFTSFGADLPAPTLMVMAISDFFVAILVHHLRRPVRRPVPVLPVLAALAEGAALHGPAAAEGCRSSAP